MWKNVFFQIEFSLLPWWCRKYVKGALFLVEKIVFYCKEWYKKLSSRQKGWKYHYLQWIWVMMRCWQAKYILFFVAAKNLRHLSIHKAEHTVAIYWKCQITSLVLQSNPYHIVFFHIKLLAIPPILEQQFTNWKYFVAPKILLS